MSLSAEHKIDGYGLWAVRTEDVQEEVKESEMRSRAGSINSLIDLQYIEGPFGKSPKNHLGSCEPKN